MLTVKEYGKEVMTFPYPDDLPKDLSAYYITDYFNGSSDEKVLVLGVSQGKPFIGFSKDKNLYNIFQEYIFTRLYGNLTNEKDGSVLANSWGLSVEGFTSIPENAGVNFERTSVSPYVQVRDMSLIFNSIGNVKVDSYKELCEHGLKVGLARERVDSLITTFPGVGVNANWNETTYGWETTIYLY